VTVRGVVLAVHGGAGDPGDHGLTDELETASRSALSAALDAGREVVSDGGSAVDAVEAAVVALEDAEVFNAGRGSVYTEDATHELEAAIVDGATRDAGAAMLLRHVANPVRLARLVMECSRHVALAGHGAELFATEQGLDLVNTRELHTGRRLEALLRGDSGGGFGTVGAVARDREGRLAAATSTGGLTGKAPGRIGDTPTIGAGTYADDIVAVSTTGQGEYFIRAVTAHSVATRLSAGAPLDEAAKAALDEAVAIGGSGGLIALDRGGTLAMPISTRLMHRGYLTDEGDTEVAILA
jgi:L-asparaginase / beta-aspartyl-peptidase